MDDGFNGPFDDLTQPDWEERLHHQLRHEDDILGVIFVGLAVTFLIGVLYVISVIL